MENLFSDEAFKRLQQLRDSVLVVLPLNDQADQPIDVDAPDDRVQSFVLGGQAERDKLYDKMLERFKPELSERLANDDFGVYELEVGGGSKADRGVRITRDNYFFRRGGSNSKHLFWARKFGTPEGDKWLVDDRGKSFLKQVGIHLRAITRFIPLQSKLFRKLLELSVEGDGEADVEVRDDYKLRQDSKSPFPEGMPERIMDYIMLSPDESDFQTHSPISTEDWKRADKFADRLFASEIDGEEAYRRVLSDMVTDWKLAVLGEGAARELFTKANKDEEFQQLAKAARAARDAATQLKEMLPCRVLPQTTLLWLLDEFLRLADAKKTDSKGLKTIDWKTAHDVLQQGKDLDDGTRLKEPLNGNVLDVASRRRLTRLFQERIRSWVKNEVYTPKANLVKEVRNSLGDESEPVLSGLMEMGFSEFVATRAFNLPIYGVEELDREISLAETNAVLFASVIKHLQDNPEELQKQLQAVGDAISKDIAEHVVDGHLMDEEMERLANTYGDEYAQTFCDVFGPALVENVRLWGVGRHLLYAMVSSDEDSLFSDFRAFRTAKDQPGETSLGNTPATLTDELLRRYIRRWAKRYEDYRSFQTLLEVMSRLSGLRDAAEEFKTKFDEAVDAWQSGKDSDDEQKSAKEIPASAELVRTTDAELAVLRVAGVDVRPVEKALKGMSEMPTTLGSDDQKDVENAQIALNRFAAELGQLQKNAEKRRDDLWSAVSGFEKGEALIVSEEVVAAADERRRKFRTKSREQAARTEAEQAPEAQESKRLQTEYEQATLARDNARDLVVEEGAENPRLSPGEDSPETRTLMEIFGQKHEPNAEDSPEDRIDRLAEDTFKEFTCESKYEQDRRRLEEALVKSEQLLSNAYETYCESLGQEPRKSFCQKVEMATQGKIMRSLKKGMGFRNKGSMLLRLLLHLTRSTGGLPDDEEPEAIDFLSEASIQDYLDGGLFQGQAGKNSVKELHGALRSAIRNSFKNIESFISELQGLYWLFHAANEGSVIHVVNATAEQFREWFQNANLDPRRKPFAVDGPLSAGLLFLTPTSKPETDLGEWSKVRQTQGANRFLLPPMVLSPQLEDEDWREDQNGSPSTPFTNLISKYQTDLSGVAFPYLIVGPPLLLNHSQPSSSLLGKDEEFPTAFSPGYLVLGEFLGAAVKAGAFSEGRKIADPLASDRVRMIHREIVDELEDAFHPPKLTQLHAGQLRSQSAVSSLSSDYFLYVVLWLKELNPKTQHVLDSFWRSPNPQKQQIWDGADKLKVDKNDVASVLLPSATLKTYRFLTQPSADQQPAALGLVDPNDPTQVTNVVLDATWFYAALKKLP